MSASTSSSDENTLLLSPKSLSPRDYMNLLQCQSKPLSKIAYPIEEAEEEKGAKHSEKDGGGTSGGGGSRHDGEEVFEEEEDNRKREQEMWAMLAGQAAFKLEAHIFHKVLPESFIKPHIFPRHVKDMQSLIEKYDARGESDRLEGAAEKWDDLKHRWHWRRDHAVALATVKCAYLHISKPLEVMMKLDKERGDCVENAKRAFRNSLLPQLHKAGSEVVDMMLSAGLLTEKKPENNVTNDTLRVPRRPPPRSAPMTVPRPGPMRTTTPESKQ